VVSEVELAFCGGVSIFEQNRDGEGESRVCRKQSRRIGRFEVFLKNLNARESFGKWSYEKEKVNWV